MRVKVGATRLSCSFEIEDIVIFGAIVGLVVVVGLCCISRLQVVQENVTCCTFPTL